jgi:uncharacterized protein (DUF1800 family)
MRQFLATVMAVSAIAIGRTGPPPRADDAAIVHVLNRIAYGPRPGDVARVRALGIAGYIDEQLRPERIADAAVAGRLAGLATLHMSPREIVDTIERPQIEARRERRQQSRDDAATQQRAPADPIQQKANSLVLELSEQKILRAVYSERQLQEVLTDFWFNHFNVDARKGRDRFFITEYERDVIRPHVFGRFRDLLAATAKSPAMLFYLDNWMSVDPNGPHPLHGRGGQPRRGDGERAGQQQARRGLNENYGRELLELHTLGVDGGYTQKDVVEAARAFTGWTLEPPQRGAGFRFDPRLHDDGPKVVLGHAIKAGGGEADGEQVLDILAKHPSTAAFIATKLVRRFVGDTPPPALVARAAKRFRDTEGDLREVMRTILTSPEFLSPDAYGAKTKTPLEFAASALRASSAEIDEARPLVREIQQLGMPLYMCQPPTGYADSADAWVNTGALVNRMNFALRLASNRLPHVAVVTVAAGADVFAGVPLSDSTRATIARAADPAQTAALTLGSPEFQRR